MRRPATIALLLGIVGCNGGGETVDTGLDTWIVSGSAEIDVGASFLGAEHAVYEAADGTELCRFSYPITGFTAVNPPQDARFAFAVQTEGQPTETGDFCDRFTPQPPQGVVGYAGAWDASSGEGTLWYAPSDPNQAASFRAVAAATWTGGASEGTFAWEDWTERNVP